MSEQHQCNCHPGNVCTSRASCEAARRVEFGGTQQAMTHKTVPVEPDRAQCAAMREASTVEAAMKIVTDEMRADPGYAWSWHCNVAMAFVDEGGDPAMANHAAARFMRLLANVEPAHELPERKAQEGREPVGYIDEGGRAVLFPARKNWLEKDKERDHAISRAQQYYSDSLLYTSPPPKSDEAMDALIKAARWFADNPDSPKSALGHITEALAALAAQQKGGE